MGKLAKEHSLDIPHLMAVELPLVVNNPDKAIGLLGGKEKISKVINSSSSNNKAMGEVAEHEEILELRLRNNRFHHPLQSTPSSREKILLKVSVPKNNLPENYKEMSLRDILIHNEAKSGKYTAHPVGIINKTHSFKGMSDFQVNTKNNKMVNDVNTNLLATHDFNKLSSYYSTEKFINNLDYKDPASFENKDHQLPPPPLFSTIKFPFDYNFEANSISMTVKDPNSGELRVVSKKEKLKLYTFVADYRDGNIPEEESPELKKNFKQLQESNLVVNTYNHDLYHCILWLQKLFNVKPIWLRKHIEDLVPSDYRRVLKQALPYVTYIFKNGPWRFCNVKFGVDPKTSKDFWVYQSEYFRLSSVNIKNHSEISGDRVLPKTVAINNNHSLKISQELIFLGEQLPITVIFQLGDISDSDIEQVIDKARESGLLFRDTLDFQDGWLQKQVVSTVRQLVRYKLNRLVRNEPIEESKVQKILANRYDEKDKEENEDNEENESENEANANEEKELDSSDSESEESEKFTMLEGEMLTKIHNVDSSAAAKLAHISELVKQESLM